MKNELTPYDKVFFVHYQCDNFNEGEQITALCIYSNGKAKEYSGNEPENIKEYANKVNELLNEGLFLVHWNQDRPNYGTDHINKRYYDLTGENLELEYSNEINLAEWLIFKYGQNYISHPRLDNLAKLNEFYGIREMELGQRTFATNRLMLLTKIYFNALNNTLKTEVTPLVKALPPQPISINESRTKKVIFDTITNIDKQGWQYAFVSEQDYNLFTDLLTNFFEYKPYTLPETTIQLKRTCKTKVAKALGEIHKELSNENKLSTDTKYFQLIRVLSHFEKETEGDLYKALTR